MIVGFHSSSFNYYWLCIEHATGINIYFQTNNDDNYFYNL